MIVFIASFSINIVDFEKYILSWKEYSIAVISIGWITVIKTNNMKKAILILIPILFGCSKVDHKADSNIALIEEYINVVENLDSEGMDVFLADDYIGYGPSFDNTIGKEDVISNWKEFTTDLYKSIEYTKSRNIAVTIEDGENMGEWVSNWAELTIVYIKDNAEVHLRANTLYQIENGKIIKSNTLYNEADALRQLGFDFVNNN